MTPDPGPRPVVALGCFTCFVFGLLAVVVLGASLNRIELIAALVVVLIALALLLARILFGRRSAPPSDGETSPPTPPP